MSNSMTGRPADRPGQRDPMAATHRAWHALRRAWGTAVVAGCLTLTGLVAGTTTASATPAALPAGQAGLRAATPAPPALRIALDDGRTSARAGDRLDYRLSVQNLGSAAVRRLAISQSLPTGLRFVSADDHGVARGKPGSGRIQWTIDVAAGRTVTLRSSARLGTTPAALLRLASVACASLGKAAAPIVCAADSDLLTAGASAARAASSRPDGSAKSPLGDPPVLVGLGVVLLLLLAAATMLYRRRRGSSGRAAMTPTAATPAARHW